MNRAVLGMLFLLLFVVFVAIQAMNYVFKPSPDRSYERYDWPSDCRTGQFAIQKEMGSLNNLPRRSDLEALPRGWHAGNGFGPSEAQVRCFAEFALEPTNSGNFASYSKADAGAIVKVMVKRIEYTIHVTPQNITFEMLAGSHITIWDDVGLDGTVEHATQKAIADGREIAMGNSSLRHDKLAQFYDTNYQFHLTELYRHFGLH